MAQPETFLAFDDDDNGSHSIWRVEALEYLTQLSLVEFVDTQAELACAECVNGTRGDCGLKGSVESGARDDEIPTSMGGYIPGSVDYITVSTYCKSDDCPSPVPAERLARRLAKFHDLAVGGTRAVSDETAREVREAESEAGKVVSEARAAANKSILEPAEQQAAALIAEAKGQVEAIIAGDKERAAEITDAAYTKRTAVRIRELVRITEEIAASLPSVSGKLF